MSTAAAKPWRGERGELHGQALAGLVGGLLAVMVRVVVVGEVAHGVGCQAEAHRAAHEAALAGAPVMHGDPCRRPIKGPGRRLSHSARRSLGTTARER
jgi:hypothetical protein